MEQELHEATIGRKLGGVLIVHVPTGDSMSKQKNRLKLSELFVLNIVRDYYF